MRELTLPAVERVPTGKKDIVAFRIPVEWRGDLLKLLKKSVNGYYRLTVSTVTKPRSTGYKSQSHHINGHCQQIAEETGNDFATVKNHCKMVALERGYPFKRDENGVPLIGLDDQPIPESERNIDTEEAGILIETIHQVAAELGIWLRED